MKQLMLPCSHYVRYHSNLSAMNLLGNQVSFPLFYRWLDSSRVKVKRKQKWPLQPNAFNAQWLFTWFSMYADAHAFRFASTHRQWWIIRHSSTVMKWNKHTRTRVTRNTHIPLIKAPTAISFVCLFFFHLVPSSRMRCLRCSCSLIQFKPIYVWRLPNSIHFQSRTFSFVSSPYRSAVVTTTHLHEHVAIVHYTVSILSRAYDECAIYLTTADARRIQSTLKVITFPCRPIKLPLYNQRTTMCCRVLRCLLSAMVRVWLEFEKLHFWRKVAL